MPNVLRRPFRAVGMLCAPLAISAAAGAEVSTRFERQDLASAARRVSVDERFRVEAVPLANGSGTLELERFEVFAPDAEIVEHGSAGDSHVAAPERTYFRGGVAGDSGSWAFLSVGASEEDVRGLVVSRGRPHVLGADPKARKRLAIREVSPAEEIDHLAALWSCGADALGDAPLTLDGPVTAAAAPPRPTATPTVYQVDLALETDAELFAYFGSADALNQYVGDLVGAASAIYHRDLRTVLRIRHLSLWSGGTSSDPWTKTNPIECLYEVGDWWRANRSSVARDVVHFLSKKNLGGGVAWISAICSADQTINDPTYGPHTAGGYGVSGSLAGAFSTTTPSLYWDLLEVMHELGHNFGSPHTHCYANWPTAGAPPVDTCWNGEGGCYSGALCGTSGQPACGGGTIMSYCHLRTGGYSNVRLAFGAAGEASQRVIDRMRAYIEGRSCLARVNTPAPVDHDGDGRSEQVVYRDGAWLTLSLSTGATVSAVWTGGGPSCIPVPGDYDGDGKAEYAQLCGGAWQFFDSAGRFRKGISVVTGSNTRPAPADYDGNGTTDVVVFRDGAWLFHDFATGALTRSVWTGPSGGTPVPMDWNGDGRAELVTYKGGAWRAHRSDGVFVEGLFTGNTSGEIPVPADYDGDGDDDVVVFGGGGWRFYDSTTGGFTKGVYTGPTGGKPAPTDHDGDGKADLTVFSGGAWHFFGPTGTYVKGLWTGFPTDRVLSRRLLP